MRVAVQNLRQKLSIDSKAIKRIVFLEEQLYDGAVTQQLIFEITDLYSRFVEYFEYVSDPMKLYFQEKIEALFYKKPVMKALLEQDNLANAPKKKIELLSDDFLKFSDINDLDSSAVNRGSVRTIDQKPLNIDKHRDSKAKKTVDILFMYKVNDQLNKAPHEEDVKVTKRLTDFKNNDVTVRQSLDFQETLVSNKIKERRKRVTDKERSKVSRYHSVGNIPSFDSNTQILGETFVRNIPASEAELVQDNLLSPQNEKAEPQIIVEDNPDLAEVRASVLEMITEEGSVGKYESEIKNPPSGVGETKLTFVKKEKEVVFFDPDDIDEGL